ncbi:hypothetical protein Trco_003272 [Trichoderma cornu-damae]|uniref:Uncharacterized protein n=1 Tax=Trichoderma cornu-damae TaxID=654480 RepID=A0A9P8QPC8_9HYPO|nr:hypothetical protein Trco_003272 [Trichoderma cornu-damae]
MDLDSREKVERDADIGSNDFQRSWQLKALLSGRIPLPTSRPKRAIRETKKTESNEANSTSAQDARSAKAGNKLRIEDERECSIVVRIAKKSKLSKLGVGRKQWKLEEIQRVVTMRKRKMSWEQILVRCLHAFARSLKCPSDNNPGMQEHFPDRTIVGIRQIFWKHSSSSTIHQL